MSARDYSAIKSCLDVTDKHIADAMAAARTLSEASPREKTLALLKHMAGVARPNTGVPRVLLLLAKMAKRDWVDGELVVKLIGDSELTVLELLVDDGASVERMLGPLRIDVPLKEFSASVGRNGALLVPLVLSELDARHLVLRGMREHRTLARKASISAFALELKGGSSGAGSTKATATKSSEHPRQTGSYDKATAVLEMPYDLRPAAKPIKAPAPAAPAAAKASTAGAPKKGPPAFPGGRKPPPLPVRKK